MISPKDLSDIFRSSLLEKLRLEQVQGMHHEKKLRGSLTSFLLLGDERFDPSKIYPKGGKKLTLTTGKRNKQKS